MASLGEEFGLAACKCLGIDTKYRVSEITIRALPADLLEVDVSLKFRPNTEQVKELAEILTADGCVVHLHPATSKEEEVRESF